MLLSNLVIQVKDRPWFVLIKFSFPLVAGVVDEDYRGNVGVVLFNFNKEPFEGVCLWFKLQLSLFMHLDN